MLILPHFYWWQQIPKDWLSWCDLYKVGQAKELFLTAVTLTQATCHIILQSENGVSLAEGKISRFKRNKCVWLYLAWYDWSTVYQFQWMIAYSQKGVIGLQVYFNSSDLMFFLFSLFIFINFILDLFKIYIKRPNVSSVHWGRYNKNGNF